MSGRAYDMSRYQRIVSVEWGRVSGSFKVSRTDDQSALVIPIDLMIYDEARWCGRVFDSGDFAASVEGDTVSLGRVEPSKKFDAEDAIDDLTAAILAASRAFPAPAPSEGRETQ